MEFTFTLDFKTKFFFSLTGFLLLYTLAFSQQSRVDSTRATWFAEHLISLDNMLTDDEGLRRVAYDSLTDKLSDAKVVAFGEPTHGDGTAFDVRNHFTKHLMQEAGVTMLALEGLGLFDSPSSIIESNLAWMWSGSQQARSGLKEFLDKNDKGSITVKGIDVQHHSIDSLFSATEKKLKSEAIWNDRGPGVMDVLKTKFRQPFSPANRDTMKMVFKTVDNYIKKLNKVEATETALFLENAKANAMVAFQRSSEPRDLQIAENLLYVANSTETDQSIVAWGANSHLVKSLAYIDNLEDDWSYDNAIPAGEKVNEHLGKDYYVIAFTACGGSFGAEHLDIENQKIASPKPGSIEALACAADFSEAAFLDLRRLSKMSSGSWLYSPLLARPLGYEFKRASWPLVIDGMVIIRNMEPSMSVN